MRRVLGRLVRSVWPGLEADRREFRRTVRSVDELTVQAAAAQDRLVDVQERLTELATVEHDDRLDRLHRLVAAVEPYQPLYGVTGIVAEARRSSADRARRLTAAFGELNGQRVLDIGSSLGYMSFHLADRGARVTGWDFNAANVLVAREVSALNGIDVEFDTRELTPDTAEAIRPGQFDAALILAVLHHVIHFQGLDRAQQIVATLLERIPVLYVELAVKGEDPELFWDAAQPEDPLEVFATVRDQVDIEPLGEIGTHLSDVRRPLYRIARKRTLTVAGRSYPYERVAYEAYEGAPMAQAAGRRRYYFAPEYLVKEYGFSAENPYNWQQIVAELFAYACVDQHPVHHALRLLDVDLTHERARLVVSRVDGELLDALAPVSAATAAQVARDVLTTLRDLRHLGLHHNDVRSWNIIVGKDGAWLLDYGLMSHIAVEDDLVALVWALHAAVTNDREQYETAKTALPDPAALNGAGLGDLVRLIAEGERDHDALLATLPRGPLTTGR